MALLFLNISESELVESLNYFSIQTNRYFSVLIFLFDTISNLLNCLVLSRPALRKNPCVFLFLISSIANLVSISFGLTFRILSAWNLNWTDRIRWLCQLRVFFTFSGRNVAFWLIAYAAVDRWLSSCSKYSWRKLSSLKNSQTGTLFLVFSTICIYLQVFLCYDANVPSAPLRCFGRNVHCRLLIDLTYAILTICCPLIVMVIFGLLTISNLRQTHLHVSSNRALINQNEHKKAYLRPTNQFKQNYRRWKRIDRSLYHALFIQIIFLSILTLPQIIEKFYMTITLHQSKSILQISIDHFIYNIALLLTYIASGMSFYIYTLAGGHVFRHTFIELFSRK